MQLEKVTRWMQWIWQYIYKTNYFLQHWLWAITVINANWLNFTLQANDALLPAAPLQMCKSVAFSVCFLEWLCVADMHRQACLWNQKEKSLPLGSLVLLLQTLGNSSGLPHIVPPCNHMNKLECDPRTVNTETAFWFFAAFLDFSQRKTKSVDSCCSHDCASLNQ